MSRLRNDYEKTLWRRIYHFVVGDEPEDISPSGYEEDKKALDKRLNDFFFASSQNEMEKAKTNEMVREQIEWSEKQGTLIMRRLYSVFAVIMGITIIVFLLATVANLPEFGRADNPVNNEVYERYVEKGLEETGAVNIVSGVILDYRAFDTLGESHVLFVACMCVLVLLRLDKKDDEDIQREKEDEKYEPKSDDILASCAKFLVPAIMLFGVYVILFGHLSPGGGFSGGAIIGAGLILYSNAFGAKKASKLINYKTFKIISVAALITYALSKSYSFFTGANHLESIISKGVAGRVISSGLILPLNICVGLVVACTMYCFYSMFSKGGMD